MRPSRTASATALILAASGAALAGPAAGATSGPVGGSGDHFVLSNTTSGEGDVDAAFSVDEPYDEVFVGDWDGDGKDTIATRVGRTVYIRNDNTGPVEKSFSYAKDGDEFIVGDWDGDGIDTFATRRGNSYHIKYTLEGGWADRIAYFGEPDDKVHVGDWDGDGDDTLAIRQGNRTMFMNELESDEPDAASWYGLASDESMVGDWDGDGRDTLAIRRGSFHLTNTLSGGDADELIHLGDRGADAALVGDWDGDGRDSFGLRTHDGDSVERDESDASRGGDRTPVEDEPVTPAEAERPGKPGPDNTGVPADTDLEVHHGDLDIRKPGTVIDGLDVRGYVRVRAKDVVIRNSIIRGGAAGEQDGLVKVIDSGASLLIEDSELVAANPNPGIDGLKGWNITARRVNIHGVVDGGHFWGNNVTIENSWIHDHLHFRNDPHHSDGSHDDGVQIQKGSNIRLTGNTIEGAYNAAIMLTQGMARTSDVKISGNWLNGGKCTINFSEKGRGPFRGIDIVANKFGRVVHNAHGDACAVIHPRTTTPNLRDNVYADNGDPAVIRQN